MLPKGAVLTEKQWQETIPPARTAAWQIIGHSYYATPGALCRRKSWQKRRCVLISRMIRTQNQLLEASRPAPVLSPFPSWARHDTPPADPAEAAVETAFAAGAALAALSTRVHAAAPWSGVWRRRLALEDRRR